MPLRDLGPEAFRRKLNRNQSLPRPQVMVFAYDDRDTPDQIATQIQEKIGAGSTVDDVAFDTTVVDGRNNVKRGKFTYRPAN